MRVDMPLVELQKYRPPLTREPEFDAFWEKTRREAEPVPLDPVLEKTEFPVDGVDVYQVTYRGFGDVRVRAWYLEPQERYRRGRLLPGLALFHGYNWGTGPSQEAFFWALQGYAVVAPSCRGQGPHTEEGESPSGGTPGWMTKGILDPDTYYYRAVYMDSVRALDFLVSRELVDAGRLGVTGGSQGGALTLAVAALDDRPRAAMADVPFLCCFPRSVEMHSAGPFQELVQFFMRWPEHEERAMQTLSYFDCMNLADRIQCPTLVSVALQDTICPPSGIYAALNRMTCPLTVAHYSWNGHEGHYSHFYKKLSFAREHLAH